jgi:uncharacterized secreted protein with C-terminal beta-propeller domain
MRGRLSALVALAVVMGGCSGGSNPARARLQPVANCDELLLELKQRATVDMEKTIDRAQRWVRGGAAAATPTASGQSPQGGASTYSTTNNQVPGADEPDFIKNDDKYIYVVAGNSFQIIDAWPPDSAHAISRTPIEGEPKKMFVYGDRAAVFSSLDAQRYRRGYQADCTYGYDCDFSGDGKPVKVTIFDIGDPSSPRLVREIRSSGSFVNARRVNQAIYVVVASPPPVLPGIQYYPSPGSNFGALKAKNRQLIGQSQLSDWLPTLRDTRIHDGQPVSEDDLLIDCQGFYRNDVMDGHAMVSLLAFDLDQDAPLQTQTIVGRAGATYATESSLYLASPQSGQALGIPYGGPFETGSETTTIHQFTLEQEPSRVDYAGSGVVKGRVLNQFSMDEYSRALRIATTSGHVPDPNVTNAVAVVRLNNGILETVGLLDGLARGEDIRSVRFDGARGFVVTFKKTDPLFVLDLEDSRSPRVVGELMVPGFSTYMQLMDASHLLTIGYDAEDHGGFAFFQGLQLQIFDVGDAAHPTLSQRELIGTRGSSSEAATNHLAFNYFPSKNVLALPIVACQGGADWSFGREQFNGLAVYDVSLDAGFHYRGGVIHNSLSGMASDACANWWTRSGSLVKRSVFMDDFVYSVTPGEIRVDSVNRLGADVAVINLNP